MGSDPFCAFVFAFPLTQCLTLTVTLTQTSSVNIALADIDGFKNCIHLPLTGLPAPGVIISSN